MAVFPALLCLFMAVIVKGQFQNVDITPREAVRRVGDELTVLCKVPYPIDSCRMTVGSVPYRLFPDNQEGDVIYSGQGLQFGECGAHIKHIKEEWNGNISCVLPPQTGIIEVTGIMRLLVAKAPGNPQLITPPQPTFKEGDVLMAQCVVPNGRPAAKISWFLDEEQLLAGTHQPIISSEPGSELQTISQNLSRSLQADDGGRRLICRSLHEALDSPIDAARQLIVHYPPKRLDQSPITIFGLKLGAEGRLNVTVRAAPPPAAQWTVGDMVLSPGQGGDENTPIALEPMHLGGGYYNVTLILRRIAKEDVDRSYYLRVSNDLGREEFSVRLSTMDEPAGVELDTGAIVGIVVAVLVLLAAVFLVVFAKATDRWCFAGGRRDHTKSSGESTPAGDVLIERGIPLPSRNSDTESAAGGAGARGRGRLTALGASARGRLGALGERVRAALPRGKDRVQAAEPQVEADEKQMSEDKKGVVYAELALGEHTADKPAPAPPATEYAEIVYTDQPDHPPQIKETKE